MPKAQECYSISLRFNCQRVSTTDFGLKCCKPANRNHKMPNIRHNDRKYDRTVTAHTEEGTEPTGCHEETLAGFLFCLATLNPLGSRRGSRGQHCCEWAESWMVVLLAVRAWASTSLITQQQCWKVGWDQHLHPFRTFPNKLYFRWMELISYIHLTKLHSKAFSAALNIQ